jgi:hypothetical protein
MQNQAPALTADELRSLRCVAGMMIPASTAHGVPGADDDTIFADIVDNLGRDAASVKQGLQHLDALADGAPLMALISVVAQCYYSDRRVMSSLGIEVRPPFQRGMKWHRATGPCLTPCGRARRSIAVRLDCVD